MGQAMAVMEGQLVARVSGRQYDSLPRTHPMLKKKKPDIVAAVDLGSNSFHMLVARVSDGQIQVQDRLRETVRLASGLGEGNKLGFEAGERALQCLARFGQRLRDVPPGAVRAVGTNTLRKARNAQAFLTEAHRALGHPIEVISGREEARLIYLGVAHSLAGARGTRLVMDIGGGSTELIIGRQFEPAMTESLHMGCVSLTGAHFADGRITADAWRRAVIAARLELRPIARTYRAVGWRTAIGASGTILAVAKVVREMGWCVAGVTLEALQKLAAAMISAGNVRKLELKGLSRERAEVFPGGVAILQGIFEALKLERIAVSDGALREGLIYDLLGRIRHEDVRGRTIADLMRRFQVDTTQAEYVEATALSLLAQVAESWQLDEDRAAILAWACRLHEIGLAISHSQYHKHGAYLLQHLDMAGFSSADQGMLAAMVRAHRRKFMPELFELVAPERRETAMRLTVLLRLAVLLNRSRDRSDIAIRAVVPHRHGLDITFGKGAMKAHPLTHADLSNEVLSLRAGGFRLRLL